MAEGEPRVVSVNVSERKGTPKRPVPEAELVVGLGIRGDAHAGTPGREVSLLDQSEIARFEKAKGVHLAPGAFAENITTSGLDHSLLKVGMELLVGPVRLRITQLGKECHEGCAIRERVGDCIMPRLGVFAQVLTGGRIKPGDPIRLVKRQACPPWGHGRLPPKIRSERRGRSPCGKDRATS